MAEKTKITFRVSDENDAHLTEEDRHNLSGYFQDLLRLAFVWNETFCLAELKIIAKKRGYKTQIIPFKKEYPEVVKGKSRPFSMRLGAKSLYCLHNMMSDVGMENDMTGYINMLMERVTYISLLHFGGWRIYAKTPSGGLVEIDTNSQ